ncbi:hypothetical protein BDA99DRAFT_576765 [Phascolomyces articulosus]|uniref:RNA polymerase II degradation factor 1 n=1 Tax=Phascolomyces articulosus TaxID=60185 RepID=A0AAD5JMZ7_9FUNG|nr:hypothetical protein BDA99DRAFT_576765 [Phascolomyces articulosus]
MTSHGSASDLKKLKSKYSSQLSTLKELFTDWTDDDLLFAIQEADGDLEVAVDRISEGLVFQWGEVKSKKSKKEAAQQKAKAAAATNPPPPVQQQTYSHHRSERSQQVYRGNNDRSRRGGRGGHGSRGPRQSNNNHTPSTGHTTNAATWGTQPPTKTSFQPQQPEGDSWASIASNKMNAAAPADDNWAQQATTDTNGGGSGWDAPSSSGGGWDSTAATTTSTTTETEAETKPSTSTTTSSEPPKTWASLLKTQPKPEPEPQPKEKKEAESSGWDAPTATTNDAWTDDNNEVKTTDALEQQEAKKESTSTWDEPTETKDAWNEPAESGWGATEETTPSVAAETTTEVEEETTTPEKEPETITTSTTEQHEEKPAENEVANEQPTQEEAPVTRKQSTTSRRLKQDAPVVLPNNSASLSSIGVKFGSLNLDDNSAETVEIQKTTLQSEPSRDQEEVISDTQYGTATTTTADAFGSAPLKQQQATAVQQQAAPVQQPQEAIPQQAQPQQQQQTHIPHQAHHHQQQQQQQQQLFGMDQLPSGYSSYLPNQPPANLSGGFGVSPMGSLPEYGVYGTEAHRAAAAMGYYDPTAYSQSPSVTSAGTYQGRDKHNQDSVASMPQHTGAQTPGAAAAAAAAQQMYPANMPYYPYYYMPNQFGYQQSYGQPFLNKNMYPNMYQQSVGKPNTGSAASPYGAAAGSAGGAAGAGSAGSPYSQNMYGQSVTGAGAGATGGYDDMGLQHHLSMGLHDYNQKPYQQQLPGFLGSTSAGQQQQQQQAGQPGQQPGQPGQSTSGQPQSNKNEVGGGLNKSAANAAGAAAGSNGHHHHQHPQQQQQYQQAMNPGNYFGHSFPYQQQYPQQHFPHFQQQQPGQQQQPSAQQPSPMGRQQPYWSQ